MDRTPPSEGGDAGSIPVESTINKKRHSVAFFIDFGSLTLSLS